MKLTLKNIGNEVDIETTEEKYFLVLVSPDGHELRVPTTKGGTEEVITFLYSGKSAQDAEPTPEALEQPHGGAEEELAKPPELDEGAVEFGGSANALGAAADSPEEAPPSEASEEANDDGRHPFVVNDDDQTPSV